MGSLGFGVWDANMATFSLFRDSYMAKLRHVKMLYP